MTLLGRWNWYLPSWLNWMPELHVEGDPESIPPVSEVNQPVPVSV
jgi:RND superfamily putative drug exporter